MIEYVGSRSAGVRARRQEAAGVGSFVRRLDWVLLGAVVGVVAYGLWAIAGITQQDVSGNPDYYVVRQGIAVALGGLAFLVALAVDPQLYRRYQTLVYAGTAGLMAVIYVAGPVTRGSRRWLDIGPFRFQPSEFGKLLFVLFLAAFLADRAKRIGDSRTVVAAIGLALGPILLVFIQPDLGTALVYGVALAAVLFVAGIRWTHLAVFGAASLVAVLSVLWLLPAVGVHVLKPYQQKRLTGFTHPDQDPRGSTYQVNQSITSVGAGGLRGRGVAGATQTNFNYLSAHATDFAFASLAEQRGFFGVAVLLLLYLLVVWRGLKVVAVARDPFSAAAAGGIVVALLFQVFVNVGMTTGVAPITGIPLPFVSVGGSSMVANLLAIGILQAIYIRSAGRRGS